VGKQLDYLLHLKSLNLLLLQLTELKQLFDYLQEIISLKKKIFFFQISLKLEEKKERRKKERNLLELIFQNLMEVF